ncbi:MAG: YARHG domain-containing protein [Schaedlerella sp.]|nr:YARHG domain-containing protein [Schaedlerella sp.]
MRCPNCGNPIDDGSLFCAYCGGKVEQQKPRQSSGGNYCPYCGAYNDEDSVFCQGCGRDLLELDVPYDSYDSDSESEKSPIRIIIIVIIAVLALALAGGGVYLAFNAIFAGEEADEEEEKRSERKTRKATDTVKIAEEDEEESKEEQENQQAADKVTDYINDIGDVSLSSGAAIQKAREEYDGLTEDQKDLVKNYRKLIDAEDEYEQLKLKEEREKEEESSGYILPQSNQRLLTSSDISGMSIKELNYARNEIYARHGRRFQSNELQRYFDSQSWYNGTISASEFDSRYSGSLSEIEKKNAEYLLSQENARGGPYVLDR